MEDRYLVEKWNIYDAHIFTRSLVQTWSLESTSLCLHTRLRVNKYFQILIIFLKLLLTFNCCVLTSQWQVQSFILEDLIANIKSVMHLVFMFQLIFFRIFRSRKGRFSHRSILPTRYVLKSFRYLDVRNPVRNCYKLKKTYSWGRNFHYSNWKYQLAYTK